jgi:hypothetical protein
MDEGEESQTETAFGVAGPGEALNVWGLLALPKIALAAVINLLKRDEPKYEGEEKFECAE